MRLFVLAASALLAASTGVSAQPYAAAAGGSPLAPLPTPTPDSETPSAYLRAAHRALVAGRIGEAQEALEMAQTRLLDRSVPLGQTDRPSNNPAVGLISQALQALAVRDRMTCMQFIQTAIESAAAQGL